MQLFKKKAFFFLAAMTICLFSLLPANALADNDVEADPVRTTIADKLIIQLGVDWAGTEFSLTTDMGDYPGVITVNNAGILAMELGGSTTYTLTLLKPAAQAVLPDPVTPSPLLIQDSAGKEQQTTTAIDAEPSANASTQATTQQTGKPDSVSDTQESVPTLHLVLFAGGAALCIGGLITMHLLKRRNDYYDEEDDE